jgi:PAS domain-containing protein
MCGSARLSDGGGPRPGGTRADAGIDQRQVLAYARDLRSALERSREITRELSQTHIETVAALAAAVDVRDEVTGGHVYRVANYGTLLADELSPELRDDPQLIYGFLLHDIGKLAVPDAVLCKPGPLDEGERQVMRAHVEHGIRFVKGVGFLRPALTIIATHHEHYDGSGYPQGLRASEIPLAARMFLVCDAFDAMVHDRPYRRAVTPEQALEELQRYRGTQFDPDVVEAVERTLDRWLAVDDRPPVPDLSAGAATAQRRRWSEVAARQVFDVIGQPMVLLSPEGRLQDANQRFLDLCQLLDPPVGMLLHEAIERAPGAASRHDGDGWRQLERDMFRGRREGTFSTTDGRRLRWFSNVIHDDAGAVAGRVLVIDDHAGAAPSLSDARTDLASALPELARLDVLLDAPDPSDPAWAGRVERARSGLRRVQRLSRRLGVDVAEAIRAGELDEG